MYKMPKKSNEMINFYERVPKHMLLDAPNPNYDDHLIKTPFRMCVSAPSGSGKTTFLLNLLQRFSTGKGTFAKIYIITRNADESLYNYLKTKSDQIFIKEGLENLPNLDKDFDKTDGTQSIVCFDDLVLAKNQKPIENYYLRSRKFNVSCVYLSQAYHSIPIFIRKNSQYVVILKLGGQREVNRILSDFGLGVSKEQMLGMYEFATAQKFSPLLIDTEAEKDKKFRKGFLEVLDPSAFA